MRPCDRSVCSACDAMNANALIYVFCDLDLVLLQQHTQGIPLGSRLSNLYYKSDLAADVDEVALR